MRIKLTAEQKRGNLVWLFCLFLDKVKAEQKNKPKVRITP